MLQNGAKSKLAHHTDKKHKGQNEWCEEDSSQTPAGFAVCMKNSICTYQYAGKRRKRRQEKTDLREREAGK